LIPASYSVPDSYSDAHAWGRPVSGFHLFLAYSLAIALMALLGKLLPVSALAPHVKNLSPAIGSLWLPMAVSLGAMLRFGPRCAPAAALSSAAFLWMHGLGLTATLFAAACCALGARGVGWVLQQARFDRRMSRPKDVLLWFLATTLQSFVCLFCFVLLRAEQHVATTVQMWLACAAAGVVVTQAMSIEAPRWSILLRARTWLWIGTLAAVTAGTLWWPPQGNVLAVAVAVLPFLLVCTLATAGHVNLAQAGIAVGFTTGLLSIYTQKGFWAQWPTESSFVALSAQIWLMGLLLALLHGLRAESDRRAKHAGKVLDSVHLGVAEWLLPQRRSRCSAQWLTWAGEAGRTPAQWLEHLHPEDKPAASQALSELLEGHFQHACLEVRGKAEQGWNWLELRLVANEVDAEGAVVRLTATVADITLRREAQAKERLSASLFYHLHEGLLITDAELKVVDVNPAYCQILGIPRHDLLGTVPGMLQPHSPDPLARQQRQSMWGGLASEGSWRGELLERRRNGETCTLSATVSIIKAPDGTVRHHVLVISDITDARLQRDKLERQANFDELTRLPNRTRIQELLASAMLAADHDGHLLAVCYLDLDRFKPVNDRFGHAAGDRLLAEVASRLRSALRITELSADSAGRLGGDEFVLLLRAATMEEARLAVERVLRVVGQPFKLDAHSEPLHVTASLGVTVYPVDRSDADTLLRHADHAMYGAKQAGRNGYQFFDPEHMRRTEERVLAISRVQEALDHHEFLLYYQPKVDMQRNVVVGLEALLRWNHPQHGLISPLQFVPLIENTGLSARVGDWVLSQALEHLAAWRRQGLELSVSVNVSARHLQTPDFSQRLSELLSRHTEPLAEWLELEVLETAAQADIDATSALLTHCRRMGVRFALDDFGTGYSTLSYLKRLPIDVLKIDRSFVSHMLEDTHDRAIVEGIIGLARTFKCDVVAEGVGTPAQARTLLELGCRLGQGSGISVPMPAPAVANWVRDFRGMFVLSAAAALSADSAPDSRPPETNLGMAGD
jgi:diguanylate cyclase (GGDEF)-like protein/PAS domain S-box-containing protein